MNEALLEDKIKRLRAVIAEKKSLLVAFSGGVDSSVLARVASEMLGHHTAAATIDSPTLPRRELAIARRVAAEIGIRHIVIAAADLVPELVRNSCDRCYFCKQGDIALFRETANADGFEEIAFGVTVSDYGEHRPGLRALNEAGAFLPLVEAGIGKPEIGPIAKALGLSNHDLPSTTCLSSRIPYGQRITPEKLAQVEAAENFLLSQGFRQVRVRHQGDTARIEVMPAEFDKLLALRMEVLDKLQELDFAYITVDLRGYRSGSMDEVLMEKKV
ncbi:MAG: ATP-dependent sacrificial sulfur transferase LarE [Candidatus Aminicenantes bacterium]|nr:ATP-dependent sacrificial sulfur transferase LarE [Acidobacteriota bacterium]MCG2810227.1 ATP-dependent sacrificial sulfur transferase LarE [Candidatus Aminicenantes bacterium]